MSADLRQRYEALAETGDLGWSHFEELLTRLATAEAERDQWKDDADHFAVQSIGQMQRADRFLAEKDTAEAQLERANAVVEAAERADLDFIIDGLNEQGETTSALQLSRIRDALANPRSSMPGEGAQ